MKMWIKFLDCLFVSMALIDFYDSLFMQPAITKPAHDHSVPRLLFFSPPVTVAALLFTLFFPVLWHRQEIRGRTDSELRHVWFTRIIRYWLAVEIFNYGFANIIISPFDLSYFRSDTVWVGLTGSNSICNYFICSYAVSVILAGIQIGGTVLLLFRRTMILGISLLLPVTLNIVLTDILYSHPSIALINATLFTTGLSYILFSSGTM